MATFFRQFCLLLRHKILLRRRQPFILLLELFWPAIVFFAILLARWQFPTTIKPTCHYEPRALPSAGLMSVIQSHVCNWNNHCAANNQTPASTDTLPYYNASVRRLTDRLMPALLDQRVASVLVDLPKGVRLVGAIVETLANDQIQSIARNGFPLKQIIRPEGWGLLETELDRLEESMATFSDIEDVDSEYEESRPSSYSILIGSSLNLIEFGQHSETSTFRSFRDIICDRALLDKFLLSPNRHHVRLISHRFCLLERRHLYHLFDLAQENIDFRQILAHLSGIFDSVGLVEQRASLDRIILMLDTLERANLFGSFGAFQNTSWLGDVPLLVDVLKNGDVDLTTLLNIAGDVEPIFGESDNGQADNGQDQRDDAELLLQLFNSDDSSLRQVIQIPALRDDEDDTTFNNQMDFDDLDASESSISSSKVDINNNNTPVNGTQKKHLKSGQKLLPKIVTNMDKVIDSVEQFTRTPQWKTLLNGLNGLQTLMEMGGGDGKSSTTNGSVPFDIQNIILHLPSKIREFNSFFNSMVPDKFQPLIYPVLNLVKRASDSLLRHVSGAFSKAISEDKIYYFESLAQMMFESISNGSLPRKCIDIQSAMCNFNQFKTIFVLPTEEPSTSTSSEVSDDDSDDATGEGSRKRRSDDSNDNDADLRGIQELGCLFFGKNYWNEEESTPVLAKLFNTLSQFNATSIKDPFMNETFSTNEFNIDRQDSQEDDSQESDDEFWTNFASRLMEVYFLATKSVNPNDWSKIFATINELWRTNALSDRILGVSRIVQLSTDCFMPSRITRSNVWRFIYRKQAIINELVNVVLEEINESADNERLSLRQIAMGSTSLDSFLRENLYVLPELLESLSRGVLFNLPQVIDRIFQHYPAFLTNWPCSQPSVADLFSKSDTSFRAQIVAIENFFCSQIRMSQSQAGRVLDEIIAPKTNESRFAPLLRVTQNKSLNLTELHENIPQLDWVEAALTLSSFKDSFEKILSMDKSFMWFPEVDNLDGRIRTSIDAIHQQIVKFVSQTSTGKSIYFVDIAMTFLNRNWPMNETFSNTCDKGVSGVLMAPVYNDKELQCLFISFRYATFALKRALDLLNDIVRNYLKLPDGSCTVLTQIDTNPVLEIVDHLPETLELVLQEVFFQSEDVLKNVTSVEDLLCKSHLLPDTFGSKRAIYEGVRRTLCGLFTQIAACQRRLIPADWRRTLEELNSTWYLESPESLSALSSATQAHDAFLEAISLFGRLSPKLVNKFALKISRWIDKDLFGATLDRINSFENLRGRRFSHILQSIAKELDLYLFDWAYVSPVHSARRKEENRDLLMALTFALNELPERLRQRYKIGGIYLKHSFPQPVVDDVDVDVDLLDSLLDWFDSHLLVSAETLLQTVALDPQRLVKLVQNRYDLADIWRAFCRAPTGQYFIVDNSLAMNIAKAKEDACKLNFNAVYSQWFRSAKPKLMEHTHEELTSVFLNKLGNTLDLLVYDSMYRKELLKNDDWLPILRKLDKMIDIGRLNISSWALEMAVKFVDVLNLKPETEEILVRFTERLECGFKSIPAYGLNWRDVPDVYENKSQVLTLYSVIDSTFTLASVSLSSILSQNTFYNQLEMLRKHGLSDSICQLQTDEDFEQVFAVSENDILPALKKLQSIVCSKQKKQLLLSLSPTSECRRDGLTQEARNVTDVFKSLQQTVSGFLKSPQQLHLSHVPPVLDRRQWKQFSDWWTRELVPFPTTGRMLFAMRAFQTIDMLAGDHVIWKAFYRCILIGAEMGAYSLRALQVSDSMYPALKPLAQLDAVTQSLPVEHRHSLPASGAYRGFSSLLTSTVSSLIFPEVNHFITFATFRQLRWIRHISHFFAQNPSILHEELCPILNSVQSQKFQQNSTIKAAAPVFVVDEDFNDLLLLLCHNHPMDWIYTLTVKSNLLNIKKVPRPRFISHRQIRERIGKLTQVLARMLDYYAEKEDKQLNNVVRFLKLKQLESIENVAGTGTVLIDTITVTKGQTARSLGQFVSAVYHSAPVILDGVDQYICSYQKSTETQESRPFDYYPRAPDLKLVMCEATDWDFEQAYQYASDHLDLKRMLRVFGPDSDVGCITPLRFMSRWVAVGQDLFEQISKASFWSDLKACRRRNLIKMVTRTRTKSQNSRNRLLKHSLRYLKFVNGALETIDKFSQDEHGTSWDNVRQVWRTMSYFALNQVPAYVPLTDIVKRGVDLPEFLNATLDRTSTLSRSKAKQAIRLLVDSMLDINAITWSNFSNIALREMICKHPEATLPSHNQTIHSLLCQESNSEVFGSLISALDREAIASKLKPMQLDTLEKGKWISDFLLPEMGDLNSISNDLLRELNSFQRFETSSEKGVNRLLISFVSLTNAKNFNALYDSIKRAADKVAAKFASEGPIVDALKRILDGLKSIKTLANQGLFRLKYRMVDLLAAPNVENVKTFLQHSLGVPANHISDILASTVDLGEFLETSARFSFDSGAFCNQSLLFGELKLKLPSDAQPMTPEAITNILCTLSVTEDFKFNNHILNQLVVRKLTSNIVHSIMNGLLKKANVAPNEMGKSLNSVRNVVASMSQVKEFVSQIGDPLERIASDLEETRDIDADFIGRVLCDNKNSFMFSTQESEEDMQRVLTGLDSEAESTFESEFCRDGARQIMKMRNGKRVWSSLKPLLIGKILFTPMAPATHSIIESLNSSIRSMPQVVDMIGAWAQTLTSLEQLNSKTTENNFSRDKLKSMLGIIFDQSQIDSILADEETLNFFMKMIKSKPLMELLKLLSQMSKCISFDRFIGVDNELVLEDVARSLAKDRKFIAGIVFVGNETDFQDRDSLPEHVQYKLRFDIDNVPTTKALKARIWEPGPRDKFFSQLQYLHGFVQLQEMIDRAITRFLVGSDASVSSFEPDVYFQQQPYKCYSMDRFGNYIRSLSPLITTMAWIFLISYLIRELVIERELHLDEVMRVMGLRPGVSWLVWFILGLSVMTFASFCAVSLLWAGDLIPASDPELLFVFLLLFNLSLIMYCYLMASLFKTATIAACSGIVAYLVSFLPFMVAITLENDMALWHKLLTCLSMSTSFCFGMMYMTRFEVSGNGMRWSNLWHSPMSGDPMNIGTAMVMLLVDALLYFLLAWYLTHVRPTSSSARKYSYFFFLDRKYWSGDFARWFTDEDSKSLERTSRSQIKQRNHQKEKSDNLSLELENDTPFNIIDPEEIKSISGPIIVDDYHISDGTLKTIPGTIRRAINNPEEIRVPSPGSSSSSSSPPVLGMESRSLYVIYNQSSSRTKHVAVSNLNLALKEGEITTLLGRNGAGKTTTISVLTGQMAPTSGTVSIYGHRLPEEFPRARKMLGYCPQYNTLFEQLTVREHLEFFAELKGLMVEVEAIQCDVDDMLRRMGLKDQENQLAGQLSGGQKRRLCVALAFIGGSKLIILDEPTASVDPVARRAIWDLIVAQKESRTVLLTTHHMDEAEILSDEVAIINQGKLLCVGSPLLLKSKFGAGYQLTVSRSQDEVDENDSKGAKQEILERLMAFARCLIPNASLIQDRAGEVLLSLPHHDEHGQAHDYATFFRCLDANIQTLGFSNYGVTSTTLEQVFLDLCSREELTGSDQSLNKSSTAATLFENFAPISNPILATGSWLKIIQLFALLHKRALHLKRDWKLLFCTLFLPCIFIAFAMAMTLIKPSFAPDPPLPMIPQIYGRNALPFMDVRNSPEWWRSIQDELLSDDGLPVPSCLSPRTKWKTAKCPSLFGTQMESLVPEHLLRTNWNFTKETTISTCGACTGPNMTIANLSSSPFGTVYNLNGSVDQFLLCTQSEFLDRRWGGWSAQMSSEMRPQIRVWFDNNGFHSAPGYLNALNNALLRAKLKKSASGKQHRITTYSHPLHLRSAQVGDQSVMQQAGDAGIAIIIMVGFIFLPTSVVFYTVRERMCEEKHLQRTFSVGAALYWASSLIWDLMILALAIGFSAGTISFFQLPIYMARQNLPAILALLAAFGWAMLNAVYVLEKIFSEPSIAFMVLYCLSLFLGIQSMVLRLLIDVFKLVEVTPALYKLFEQVCVIFPPYLLLSAIVDIHRNQLFTDAYELFDQDVYQNPFEMLRGKFIVFIVEGFVLFAFNLFIESGAYRRFGAFFSLRRGILDQIEDEDDDVASERRRVVQRRDFAILTVDNVHKHFKNRAAVNSVTFALPEGECFGLLGVNGAGKTTLFRMLTGDMQPTCGEVSLYGTKIEEALNDNTRRIGYCPQADALDSYLTPVEHLRIYARLRGVSGSAISAMVSESIRKFQLVAHQNRPVDALSRGNRRKLCLAIAMLGDPKLVLLDEPTAGLDAQSRRAVSANIREAIQQRRSVLITSHSLEECDILCSRLAIMVNGRFCCLGSPQRLKNKYGTGFIVSVRISQVQNNFRQVIDFFAKHFPQSALKAHHHTMLEFALPSTGISLSDIFSALQQAKQSLYLHEYTVSQPTLDQVFVSFANEQRNDRVMVVKNSNNKGTGAETPFKRPLQGVGATARSTLQHGIKRHASLLISCCKETHKATEAAHRYSQAPKSTTNLNKTPMAPPLYCDIRDLKRDSLYKRKHSADSMVLPLPSAPLHPPPPIPDKSWPISAHIYDQNAHFVQQIRKARQVDELTVIPPTTTRNKRPRQQHHPHSGIAQQSHNLHYYHGPNNYAIPELSTFSRRQQQQAQHPPPPPTSSTPQYHHYHHIHSPHPQQSHPTMLPYGGHPLDDSQHPPPPPPSRTFNGARNHSRHR